MANQVTGERLGSVIAVEQKNKALFEKLVKQAKRGNREALKTLCESISRGVMFRVMSRLRDRADAEDVTQEVLLRVCDKIGSLQSPGSFGAWLNTIIINETSRHLTKNTKSNAVLNIEDYMDAAVDEDEDNQPFEYAIREEDRRAVMEIVDRLPERQWEAVMLHYYEGLSVTETAAAMDVAQPTVTRYLTLSRDKIKKELGAQVQKTGTMNSFALLPIGPLLMQILRCEAEGAVPVSKAWINQAVMNTNLAGSIAAESTVTGFSMGLFIKTVVLLSSAVAVALGLLWAGGVFQKAEIPEGNASAVAMQGEIVFSGGDVLRSSVNPESATVWANNERGELTARLWQIISPESEAVLYSGEGGSVDDALVQMLSSAEDGEYALCFWMEDAAGSNYTVTRHFFIQSR